MNDWRACASSTSIAKSPSSPTAKIRKPVDFRENGLSNHELYSIAAGTRVRQLDGTRTRKFVFLKGIAWKVDRLTSKLL